MKKTASLLLLHIIPFEFTYQVFLGETMLLFPVVYFSFSELRMHDTGNRIENQTENG